MESEFLETLVEERESEAGQGGSPGKVYQQASYHHENWSSIPLGNFGTQYRARASALGWDGEVRCLPTKSGQYQSLMENCSRGELSFGPLSQEQAKQDPGTRKRPVGRDLGDSSWETGQCARKR